MDTVLTKLLRPMGVSGLSLLVSFFSSAAAPEAST